jgi:hypothetical protein
LSKVELLYLQGIPPTRSKTKTIFLAQVAQVDRVAIQNDLRRIVAGWRNGKGG